MDHWLKLKESEKRDMFLDIARELKKTMEHGIDGDTVTKRLVHGPE